MARPLRIEFDDAFYHVTARGDEQKRIFVNCRDRQRFLEYLLSATQRYGIVVHCYCLMTNHYHLFLQTPRGNLSQVMHYLNGSYTTYYNVKRKHAGHLFQGRYHAIVVEANEYALQISRYMHLNPVRAGMVMTPEEYSWSSYRAYVGVVPSPPWLNLNLILGVLGSSGADSGQLYRQYVEDLANGQDQSPLADTIASVVLGSEDFVEAIMVEHVGGEKERSDLPAIRRLNHRFTIEDILSRANEIVADRHVARDITLYLCQHYSGLKLKEIGSHFGLGDSGVTKASLRLRKKMETDSILHEIVIKIAHSMGFVQL